MKKYISIVLVIFVFLLAGCDGDPNDTKKQTGDDFCNESSQFIFVERVGENHYIVADKDTKYEYYMTSIATGNGAGYIIGGNVLDENGKPKKYTSK